MAKGAILQTKTDVFCMCVHVGGILDVEKAIESKVREFG